MKYVMWAVLLLGMSVAVSVGTTQAQSSSSLPVLQGEDLSLSNGLPEVPRKRFSTNRVLKQRMKDYSSSMSAAAYCRRGCSRVALRCVSNISRACTTARLRTARYNTSELSARLRRANRPSQADSTCTARHELVHTRQNTCQLSDCSSEAQAYVESRGCVLTAARTSCQSAPTSTLCRRLTVDYCSETSLVALQNCRVANASCGCFGCTSSCVSTFVGCADPNSTLSPASRADLEARVTSYCSSAARLYCS